MMKEDELKKIYENRYRIVLTPLALSLEDHITELVADYPRIDRITARAKSIDRFIRKAKKIENGKIKYSDPLNQIQDQLGARIITFYKYDLDLIKEIILNHLAPIETRKIVPDSINEFGYEGYHFILFIPEDLLTPEIPREDCPYFFELQIKSLFQHAWAEANHDLAYKPVSELSRDQLRRIAFTAAQAWGADYIFNELAQDLIL